jgi:hypothetical protein
LQLHSSSGRALHDEALWTFLCAYGYAVAESGSLLYGVLCEESSRESRIWIEGEPVPPRINEGNTMVDLAAGDIRRRPGTTSGIEFAPPRAGNGSIVLFVECKWLSDMSGYTKYDPLRSQMLRVLENALAFQTAGAFPETVHFTLLTPRIFKKSPRSRGYGPLFESYSRDPLLIAEDLKAHKHPVRASPHWTYPDLAGRIGALRLHWVEYETVIESMPVTQFKNELMQLARRTGLLNLA